MFVHIHIFCYSWRAPRLSEEQEREWGETLMRLGTEHFLWQFRKWVGSNPMSPPPPNLVMAQLDREPGPTPPRLDNFFSILQAVTRPVEYWILAAYLLVCIGCGIYTGDRRVSELMLPIGLVFWGIWVGSLLFGFRRYRKWLEQLSAGYRGARG